MELSSFSLLALFVGEKVYKDDVCHNIMTYVMMDKQKQPILQQSRSFLPSISPVMTCAKDDHK
jgi:hypothetical protein